MLGFEVVVGAALAGAVGAGRDEYQRDRRALAAPTELSALRSFLQLHRESVVEGHRAVSAAWGVSPPLTLLSERHLAAASRRGVAVPQLLALRRAKDAVEEATALENLAVEYEKQLRMSEERGTGLRRMYISELIERLEELGERLRLRALPELTQAKLHYDRCRSEPESGGSLLPQLSPSAPQGTDTVLRQMVGRWHYNDGSNAFRISRREAADVFEFSERNSKGALRGELRPIEGAVEARYGAELVWDESGQAAGRIEVAYEDGQMTSRYRPVGGDFGAPLTSRSLDLKEEILQPRGRLGTLYGSAAERLSLHAALAKVQDISARYAPSLLGALDAEK